MPVCQRWPIVIGIVHPNISGWLSQAVTRKKFPDTWYNSLNKPAWTPPDWAFAPIWTALYSTMGYSSYLVWRDGGGFKEAAIPLSIYGTHLALNFAWTPIFFGAQNIKLAFYEILAVLGTSVAMTIAFYKVNPIAGYLNIPLIAWTTGATVLTYNIYRNNKPAITSGDEAKQN